MGIEWGESHDGVLQINANNIYIYIHIHIHDLGVSEIEVSQVMAYF